MIFFQSEKPLDNREFEPITWQALAGHPWKVERSTLVTQATTCAPELVRRQLTKWAASADPREPFRDCMGPQSPNQAFFWTLTSGPRNLLFGLVTQIQANFPRERLFRRKLQQVLSAPLNISLQNVIGIRSLIVGADHIRKFVNCQT